MFAAAFIKLRLGCPWGILRGPLMGFLQWMLAHTTGGLKLRASSPSFGEIFPSVQRDSYAAVQRGFLVPNQGGTRKARHHLLFLRKS